MSIGISTGLRALLLIAKVDVISHLQLANLVITGGLLNQL